MIIANSLSTNNTAGAAYVGTWANRPAANTLGVADQVFITDFPIAGLGSWWKPVPALNIFSPTGGNVLGTINAEVLPTDGTAVDQNFISLLIPSGMLSAYLRVTANCAFKKDSGATAGTYRFRIGTTNTDADAVVHSVSVGATARSIKVQTDIFLKTTTTATATPTANGGNSESTTVWPADVAISDTSANDLYFSVWLQPAGAIVMSVVNCNINLVGV